MKENQIVIIDSSVMVKWLSVTLEDHVEQANAILHDLSTGKSNAHAPDIALYEVGNALLKGKGFSIQQAVESFDFLDHLPLMFHPPMPEMMQTAYAIAHAQGTTYYDAAFLALAKMMEGTLVTDNVKHQTGVSGIAVLPLAQYRTEAR